MPARLLLRRVGPLCCAALIATGLAGCGGSDTPSKKAAASTSATSSGTSSASGTVAAVVDRIEKAGSGTFAQSDSQLSGTTVSRAAGSYSLRAESVQAKVTVPDTTTTKVATARLRLVGGRAYLQVDQWKEPSRSCWLASTPQTLSQEYALDVSSGSTPLALVLAQDFKATGSSGPGTYQGQISLQAALPLLSGGLKQQVEQAKPQGTTPAYLVDDGRSVTVTVPGYGLIPELAAALGVDASQFDSIRDDRYVASVTPGGSAPDVTAPAASKQMTDQQLAANRCG